MAFSRLPSEIKDMVFDYLIAEANEIPLSRYVTVNRSWQAALEEHIWNQITLRTRKRLSEFICSSLFRTIPLIKHIYLLVELDSYYQNGDSRCRFETIEERHRNNIIFTVSIQFLFNYLASWPTRGGQWFTLRIEAYSPDDQRALTREAFIPRRDEFLDITDKRFQRSWLQFDESLLGFQCKPVPVVNVFFVTEHPRYRSRKIEPVSCSRIIAKLPQLQWLQLHLDDRSTSWDPELRNRHRKDFADSIPTWPSSLIDFSLHFPFDRGIDQLIPLEVLSPAGTPDPLSLQLHKLSQRLRSFSLAQCVIGSEILESLAAYGNVESPSWSNLTTISLKFVPITPSGTHMFGIKEAEDLTTCDACFSDSDLDEPYDTDEPLWLPPEDRAHRWFVRTPNQEMFNEYFLLAGKAALQMPKLVSMLISSDGEDHVHGLDFEYEVKYGRATVNWRLGHDGYQPSAQVEHIWEEVAIKHTGWKPEVLCSYFEGRVPDCQSIWAS